MAIALWRRSKQVSTDKHVVAIGNFDGIHLGHQQILAQVATIAHQKALTSCVLTFEPYPQTFLYPDRGISRLTSLREKVRLLEALGIQRIYALPFNAALAKYSAEQFIQEILIARLQAQIVVIGEDFRFGKQREGDVALLQSSNAFTTQVTAPVVYQGTRISSTYARQVLGEGNLVVAQHLLGRPYQMMGKVVHGNQRGRQLGFPTANIALKRRIPPVLGVFAVKAYGIGQQVIGGVANVGKRPTVDGTTAFLEIFLFDFDHDIYGAHLTVEFVAKIRDEMRFGSIEALRAQIQRDAEQAKKILAACS